jgi:hypothetical protein
MPHSTLGHFRFLAPSVDGSGLPTSPASVLPEITATSRPHLNSQSDESAIQIQKKIVCAPLFVLEGEVHSNVSEKRARIPYNRVPR